VIEVATLGVVVALLPLVRVSASALTDDASTKNTMKEKSTLKVEENLILEL
jgi:hypothetical protein